jgi:hypothetical protein
MYCLIVLQLFPHCLINADNLISSLSVMSKPTLVIHNNSVCVCVLEFIYIYIYIYIYIGVRSSVVVKGLCYKPEGRRFDTR